MGESNAKKSTVANAVIDARTVDSIEVHVGSPETGYALGVSHSHGYSIFIFPAEEVRDHVAETLAFHTGAPIWKDNIRINPDAHNYGKPPDGPTKHFRQD